ncbi:MAG: hypothetical protein ACYTHJ_07045 [Planctomycetota bacterium]|jgi:hypothetical protein
MSTRILVLLISGFCIHTAAAQELLWLNPANGNSTSRDSMIAPDNPYDAEIADDFDVVGSVERVLVSGYGCFNCTNIVAAGIYLRFYEPTADNAPGALQAEYYLEAGDPAFLYNPDNPSGVDITLPQPFEATGHHFISAQIVFETWGTWTLVFSNMNNPQGSAMWFRDHMGDDQWVPHTTVFGAPTNHDFGFTLYGTSPNPDPPAVVTGCGEWVNLESPNPDVFIDARLKAMEVIEPWDIWAVGSFTANVPGVSGYDQFSYTMHFDGVDWTIVPSPNPSPAPGLTWIDLKSVSASSPNDVWAAGSKNDVGPGGYVGTHSVAFHWDGTEWIDAGFPQPEGGSSPMQGASGDRILDVEAIAPDDVWFVGAWFRFLPSDAVIWPGAAIHWDGSDFEVFEPPFTSPTGEQQLNAISAVASDDIWAVGSEGGSQIYHFDGSEWSHVPGPEPGWGHSLSDVIALAADDVWAGGTYYDSEGTHALMLHWDGTGWTQVPSPAGGSNFTALAPGDIFSMGINGYAHWDGTAWTAQPGPEFIPSGTLSDIAYVNPCEIWGVGMKSVASALHTYVAKVEPSNPDGDADGDTIPDEVDNCPNLYNPDQADCDADGMGDACALFDGLVDDCNGNGTPDNCDSFTDCNVNQVPDECEPDCQANGVVDECDLTSGTSIDCDLNGVPDECDVFDDCNLNDVSDFCDVSSGSSADVNTNGVPDECEAMGENTATVTTVDDIVDLGGMQQMGDLPGPDGKVSFREALMAVNNTPGPQTVAFNIPEAEWWLVDEQALLRQEDGIFALNDDGTTLDFTTQTAFTGDTNPNGGEVGIYGLEPNAWGIASIYVNSDDCTVKGLDRVLQRGYGLRIQGNNNRVIGCTISGPLYAGVYIAGPFDGPAATGNIVGGTGPGEGNQLSSGNDGVRIDGPADGNIVIGNTLASSVHGVAIRGGASNNRIGGPSIEERNILAGSGHYGEHNFPVGGQLQIWDSPGNIVEGNWIGIDASGSVPTQRGSFGVQIRGSVDTIVRNNVIGGIALWGGKFLNERYGIGVNIIGTSSEVVLDGNTIGIAPDGITPAANRTGVIIAGFPASETPSDVTFAGNTVAHSEDYGVLVSFGVTGATISQNSIFDNGELGIFVDPGANGGQSAPSVAFAATDGTTTGVIGSLAGAAMSVHVVELFGNDQCDGSGFGEGETFLGSVSITTDDEGFAAFQIVLDQVVAIGSVITATATESSTGNSSEFSACAIVESGDVMVDSDGDGLPDDFDNCPTLANPQQADCDLDGTGDLCAIADGQSADCNANTIPDGCDLTAGSSDDQNSNGVPDECEGGLPAPPAAVSMGTRYLAITPAPGDDAVALVVTGHQPLDCVSRFVQEDETLGDLPFAQLPEVWGTAYVHGEEIMPDTTYDIEAESEAAIRSAVVTTTTWAWADVDGNAVTNFSDVLLLVLGFQGDFQQAALETLDIYPCMPNRVVNFDDILQGVLAFQGANFPCSGPCASTERSGR